MGEGRQTSLPRERERIPDPKEHVCEWCDRKASKVREIQHKIGRGIVPTGKFMFACRDHIETMNRTIGAIAANPGKP